MRPKGYLVTGGSGFLGSSLVKALVREGCRVRVLDDFSRGTDARLADVLDDIEVVRGDIRDAETVQRAVRGMDGVCHMAFVNGTRHFYERPAYVLDVGVKGMVNVLDACVRESVRELILASSSEVYQTPMSVPTDESVPLSVPDPLNPRYSYGGGKIISELMALNYGRERLHRVLVFRPHNVYGPDMGGEHVIPQFVGRMLELKQANQGGEIPFPIQGSGRQTRSFIYVEDFTRALMILLDRGEHMGIYNVGTMEEIAIEDLAQKIGQHLGVKIRVVPGSEAPGGTPRRCPDTRKIRALGFEPRFRLDDGLLPTVEWYRDHPAPPSEAGTETPEIPLEEKR